MIRVPINCSCNFLIKKSRVVKLSRTRLASYINPAALRCFLCQILRLPYRKLICINSSIVWRLKPKNWLWTGPRHARLKVHNKELTRGSGFVNKGFNWNSNWSTSRDVRKTQKKNRDGDFQDGDFFVLTFWFWLFSPFLGRNFAATAGISLLWEAAVGELTKSQGIQPHSLEFPWKEVNLVEKSQTHLDNELMPLNFSHRHELTHSLSTFVL